MIEKEVERQIAYLHAAYGLVAGVVLGLYYNSTAIPFLSVLIWGFIISYPAMIISKSIFKLSAEDFDTKAWITKGFLYFFPMWIVVWVFVYNLV
jgi:hypothetical protein